MCTNNDDDELTFLSVYCFDERISTCLFVINSEST